MGGCFDLLAHIHVLYFDSAQHGAAQQPGRKAERRNGRKAEWQKGKRVKRIWMLELDSMINTMSLIPPFRGQRGITGSK
jgi:ribosomal protein L4